MSDPAGAGRSSLTARLLLVYAVIFLGVIVLFSIAVTRSVSAVMEQQIVSDLADRARVVDAALEPGDDATAQAMADVAGFRLTIIDPDGTVEFDSVFDASEMEDHGDRPEVVEALSGAVGTDTRTSATLDDERLYVAILGADGDRVVRMSVTTRQIADDLSAVRQSVIPATIVIGLLGLLLVWTGARRVARPVTELTAIAERAAAGETNPPERRSTVTELDRLGMSVTTMAQQLGGRIDESESQRVLLESVLEALPQGVLLVAGDDGILYANEQAHELVGPFQERISSIAPRGFHRCVRAARDGSDSRSVEFDRGSPRRILRVTATLLGSDGRVLVLVQDITDRKRVEAIRRDFVADASHELKTPVASVLASSEALRMALDRDVDRARAFSDQTEKAARQLARIVDDLLDLSRLEASDRQPEVVGLHKVVADVVESLQHRAREARIELSSSIDEVEVTGSPPDLALAVRNLCDNALRYTDAGGSVHVALVESDGMAEITVRDTGVGIPTRSLDRVFERFYRVDEARSRATGGTGLGLSIVRHVAETHGGSVTVTSQLGVGSTFTIRIPT